MFRSSNIHRTVTQHLTSFMGGNALSPFRAKKLLAFLQATEPRITAVQARYVHWAVTAHEPTPELTERRWARKLGV